MFSINNLSAGYTANSRAIEDVSLEIPGGEIFCLLGRNGAGKTTILKSVMGLVPHRQGVIQLDETKLLELDPHQVSRCGIGYVPQGRRLFSEMTVRENLEIGRMGGTGDIEMNDVFGLFPVLRERLDQMSGTLSGGEQQMLAMARALCVQPRVLLLDEPTEGLMPSMIAAIREVVTHLAETGVAVLLVEQRIDAVIQIAQRVGFMVNGKLVDVMPAANLDPHSNLVKHHLGV